MCNVISKGSYLLYKVAGNLGYKPVVLDITRLNGPSLFLEVVLIERLYCSFYVLFHTLTQAFTGHFLSLF